jgi:hypothetical protein
MLEGAEMSTKTYPIKKVIGFNPKMIAAVNRWRRKQIPAPSGNAAIRGLIQLGLVASRRATTAQYQRAQ